MNVTTADHQITNPLAGRRPLIMGVINVTPDSFSDGGRFGRGPEFDHSAAIAHAMALHQQGAAIVDVGGEASSFHRRGIAPVDADQQLQRVLPVISGIHAAGAAHRPAISVDTRLAEVVRAGLQAGADMINDISAGETDPEILRVAAAFGCPIVLMHMEVETPDRPPENHPDICAHVFGYLARRAAAAIDAGLLPENIILDPGIGFGKSDADNWKLLMNIDRLTSQRFPVLLGVSRKRLLAKLAVEGEASRGGGPAAWHNQDLATACITMLAVQRGVRLHRVHQVSMAAIALAALARMTAPPDNHAACPA